VLGPHRFSYHGVGYMVYWLLRGWAVFAEEMTDWLDCGTCTRINNLAGFISWGAGFVLWMTSLRSTPNLATLTRTLTRTRTRTRTRTLTLSLTLALTLTLTLL
jgi:hypothetical protein